MPKSVHALTAILLLTATPVLDARAAAPPAPPATSLSPQALATQRHQQPTQSEVDTREAQRFGAAAVARQQRQGRADVEEMYNELMRETAPRQPR